MSVLNSAEIAVDQILEKIGNTIVLGAPLGAGKANTIINCIYQRAKADPKINLTILTALTLEKPKGKSDLEKRFLGPMAERVFGNYPDLYYELDRVKGELPENIEVIEFYFPPGKFLKNPHEQQNYLSTNYTHAARDVVAREVNVVCQQVCKGEIDNQLVYSLSCNPDITIDIVDEVRKRKMPILMVGQVNQDLPFMYGESVVAPDFFDILVDNRELDFKVFGPPKMSVSDADHMIGLHASTLVKDDGEIQIGIGSLGDALVYSLCLRQKNNDIYRDTLNKLEINPQVFPIIESDGSLNLFDVGLFAATEMFVDCFSTLYQEKILKKKVFDSIVIQRLLNEKKIQEEFGNDILELLYQEKTILPQLTKKDVSFLKEFGILKSTIEWENGHLILEDGSKVKADIFDEFAYSKIKGQALGHKLRNGAVAHAGFFLGPTSFYQFLKDLPIEERKLIRMKRISQINQLYGHEEIDRLQRKNGRFINTCMKVSLNGSASSDALENLGQVSGVGGQYNFVAMAHELPDARSILQLRSCRINKKGDWVSNIVFNYGNCTIPRHLRDVVITEYGIADLRGKTDQEVAIELIKISDSRFQSELLTQAKKAGKIANDYQLPVRFSKNFPARYQLPLKAIKKANHFPAFPFGTDLTSEELKVGKVLKHLKALSTKKSKLIPFIFSSLFVGSCPQEFVHLLKRMQLGRPKGFKEILYSKMLTKGFVDLLK